VSKEQEVSEVMKEIEQKHSALHVLVNCAGIGIAKKTYSAEKDQVHSLNLFQKAITVSCTHFLSIKWDIDKTPFLNILWFVNVLSLSLFDYNGHSFAYYVFLCSSKSSILHKETTMTLMVK